MCMIAVLVKAAILMFCHAALAQIFFCLCQSYSKGYANFCVGFNFMRDFGFKFTFFTRVLAQSLLLLLFV